MIGLRMARVLVSGASGLIGSALVPALKTSGAQVSLLVRPGKNIRKNSNGTNEEEQIPWDPAKPIAPETISRFDNVLHLAGESIVGRWTDGKKARIRDSRVTSTMNLARAMSQTGDKPAVFICASAIGYYGDRGDEVLREESTPGRGFLSDVCQQWEAATKPASKAGIRTVNLRTGIVLSTRGGALAKMLLPFRLGLGGRVGDGRQWMSWIDLQDVVGAILHIMKTDLVQGPVNMVAPRPVTNIEFTKLLAGVLARPAILPMPAAAAKLAFGEMADSLLLASQRVEPSKLVMSGYPFRFRELKASLENIKGQ